MPDKTRWEQEYKSPTDGWDFDEILSQWEDLNLLAPNTCIEVPIAWLLDPRLKPHDKIILFVLHNFANSKNVVTISRRQFLIYANCNKQRLQTGLKTLVEHGYLKLLPFKNGTRAKYKLLVPVHEVGKPKKKNKTKTTSNTHMNLSEIDTLP